MRPFIAVCLMLLGAAPSSAQEAQELAYEGEIDAVLGEGPDLTPLVGEMLRACVVYDPTVPEDSSTLGDPTTGNFDDATLRMRIEIAGAGIDIVFEPVLEDLATVVNDVGVAGIAQIDQLLFDADGPLQSVPIDGDPIIGAEFGVTESGVGAAPDLVTTADSLPLAPLDLDSAGLLSLDITIGFESLNAQILNVGSFSPIDPAQAPIFCPEPAAGLAVPAVLACLVGIRAARPRCAQGLTPRRG